MHQEVLMSQLVLGCWFELFVVFVNAYRISLGWWCSEKSSEMYRNVQQNYCNKLVKNTHLNKEITLPTRQYNHVCSGSNSLHSHHRVGYDGQNKVLSPEYAVILFGEVLLVSTYSDQNSSSDPKEKSYVYRWKYLMFHYFLSNDHVKF